jgi:hypothetical protein
MACDLDERPARAVAQEDHGLLDFDDATGKGSYLRERMLSLAGVAASRAGFMGVRTSSDGFHPLRSPLPSVADCRY